MSVLVDSGSRVLIQGITGKEGSFHTEQMRAFGTNVVAGVSPGKGGSDQNGVPVFDTVADAVAATGADVAGVFVPPAFAADAIMEAAAAAVPLTVCITEGIPIHDTARARATVERTGTALLGPNCPGIVTPAQCKVGIIPNHINRPGPVGIVGRSGTLTYEVIQSIGSAGYGQTTSVGIGGDPVLGLSFTEVMRLFAEDAQTQCVVMIGEIGGSDEEDAARWVKANMKKPVVGFIAGVTAPPGKRMGHAGAIISGGKGTAQEKLAVMEECGIKVTRNPAEMGKTLKSVLKK